MLLMCSGPGAARQRHIFCKEGGDARVRIVSRVHDMCVLKRKRTIFF